MNDDSNRWSVGREVKKRKTQEILRIIEAKQVQTVRPLRPVASVVLPGKRLSQPPARFVRTRPETPSIAARAATAVLVSTHRWTRRQRTVASIAAILTIVMCMATTLVAVRQPTLSTALPPLPTVQATDVIGYLRRAGVPVTNVRRFSGNNGIWTAKQELEFHVQNWDTNSVFLVLSYDSAAQAGVDAFTASLHRNFKHWNLIQISSVLLLAAPGAAPTVSAEIANHLTQYIVAPYRSFIPTATPSSIKR